MWQGPAGVAILFLLVRLFRGRFLNRAPSPHAAGVRRLDLLAAAGKQQLERRVFISHTGKDEGAKNFATSVLKPALEAAGLQVYVDYDSIEPGSKWRAELVDAAANSMVFVAVLSKQYYTRYWCMLELDLALNAHAQAPAGGGEQGRARPVVIPVMYDQPEDVIPSDVADDGVTKPQKVVQQWAPHVLRQVLRKEEELPANWAEWVDPDAWASNLAATKGQIQHLRRAQQGPKDQDWQLAGKVVEAAVRQIPPLRKTRAGLVGVEEQRAKLLAQRGDSLGLWLSGPGGMGKSTMSNELWNWWSPGFSHSAFVTVEESDGPSQLATRLSGVLKALTGTDPTSGDVAALRPQLEDFVANRKVLYMVDNVWTASQLDALLPTNWGPGSTVIVTSRFKEFTDSATYRQVSKHLVHVKVDELDKHDAKQLFRTCLGASPQPEGIWKRAVADWEESILEVCGGLPLALELAGGALGGKLTEQAWKDVHEALTKGVGLSGSENQLQGVVTHSLQRLQPPCTSMFLDVATLLRGKRHADALAVWRAWWLGAGAHFDSLLRSSLVGVDEEGRLAMHDVLVAHGRGIVLQKTPKFEEHYGSRVWVEGGKHVGYVQGTGGKVVAARLSSNSHGPAPSPVDLSEARILWLDGVEVPAHGNVLWLELQGCGGSALAPWLRKQPALVILDAPHQDEVDDLTQAAGCMPNLLTANLRWSKQLASLPESFGQLEALKELDLSHCEQLESLPESFGRLVALQQLNLTGCTRLASLPKSFGRLVALQRLTLDGCERLASLPESFGRLAALQELYLRRCTQLDSLPQSFGCLKKLQVLSMGLCTELVHLPRSFGQLAALQELDMRGCRELASGLWSLEELVALRQLDVRYCPRLEPEDVLELQRLLGPRLHVRHGGVKS